MRLLRHLLLVLFVGLVAAPARADYLEVRRSATIKAQPEGDAEILMRPDIGAFLVLLQDTQTNGYYRVQVPGQPGSGWIYRTLVRRHPGTIPVTVPTGTDSASPNSLAICSFNIKWLGHYKRKEAAALADLVKDYDIVVVQEMVAPPQDGTYPDGTSYTADPESRAFLTAMQALGFEMVLSPEDTGPSDTIHTSAASTEWFAFFYRDTVRLAPDLPQGFLADDRSAHPVYQRVPFAVGFRTPSANLDFVLINVHLTANDNRAAEREAELQAIRTWVNANDAQEKDFIILGDMNIASQAEMLTATPTGFLSLNRACLKTNTSPGTDKPYDHVLFRPTFSTEVDRTFGFRVIDLVQAMRPFWTSAQPYPGDPYDGNLFPQHFSDHSAVVFGFKVPASDDDQ